MEKHKLTLAIIESLKAQGLSQSEIGRQFGVTRQAVSRHVRIHGGSLTPRQRALESWPWAVPTRFNQQSVFRKLRNHGEFWATQGEGMGFVKLSALRGFYERLRGEVVEFDPGLPPSEGISVGGFAYRPRLGSDGDLLIRVNEHTHLSDEGRRIWRLPDVMPEPLAGKV